MVHENVAKEAAIEKKGELLDSVTITMGSPTKGTAVALKCYIDLMDISKADETMTKTEIKVSNLIKLKQKMVEEGVLQQG